MEENKIFDLSTPAPAAEPNGAAVPSMVNDDDTRFIVDLTTRATQYCSMKAESDNEKAALFNATNNPDFRLADLINMEIKVKDVFVEAVHCTNRDTGEVNVCPRVVLIDDKNVGYQCVSIGVFSAIKKLFGIYGEPMYWSAPIKMMVKQITKGERQMLTLNVVTA